MGVANGSRLNVSPEQLAVLHMLAECEGVTDLVEFLELDHRALEGRFDRVVSIGMTIRCWRFRFAVNRSAALALTDERFCPMWEFYLSAVDLEFMHGWKLVFQVLLSPKRDAVTIMRDFMLGQARQPAAAGAR